MRYGALLCVLIAAGPVAAADWALRSGDMALRGAALEARIADRTLEFYDGGRAVYGPGSDYAYIYADGRPVSGRYDIGPDGAVCVAFDNGWSRCDIYVMNGARLYLMTEEGDRFPVRD